MQEIVHSVGIDIGTSTTQLVFSRLVVENLAGSYAVPRVGIVEKEVVYRSNIYFTPLSSPTEIDAEAVKKIVRGEYAAAGMKPSDLQTGAVIITGDTARKHNANQVLAALSDLAGDFVVATAGPDLESVLSARGAGTDKISEEARTAVVNLDVGGGTTNMALYEKGTLHGVACLDIGGRLIKTDGGKITYIFHKIQALADARGVKIRVGDAADVSTLTKVCELMAEHLAQALYLKPQSAEHAALYTNDGKPIPSQPAAQGVTFSGGVADYIYKPTADNVFRYGDIGVLLGRAIRNYPAFGQVKLFQAAETIRATVVGAGTHTTEVSGSTISYAKERLPIKNIPILKVSEEDEKEFETLASSIQNQMPLYRPEGRPEQIAIAFTGRGRTSFADVQRLAAAITEGAKEAIESQFPLIIVVEADIGKVLGNALKVRLEHRKDVICIDGIRTLSGDYIDIGVPLVGGHVVPVVIKTLIFNS
ncbi:MAG: ethanolamine ammonia-lyase reactivating factor EutA [Intestinibacillus sp.]